MKQFCCGDVVPGCKASFQGSTDDEILGAVAIHARQDHGLTDIPASLISQVRSKIRNVPAS
jgi:predicted small metal-binding protein